MKEEIEMEVRMLLETTVKRLLCCGFRRTGKATGQMYQCWQICREINVFPQLQISHVLRFISICDLLTYSSPQKRCIWTVKTLIHWRLVACIFKLPRRSGSVTGWGTMLQGVPFPMRSLDFFNWPNPSSRTMALGSTQPPTEMSIRNLPGGKERPARKAENLTAICEPIF
jgi:hypothetical protein